MNSFVLLSTFRIFALNVKPKTNKYQIKTSRCTGNRRWIMAKITYPTKNLLEDFLKNVYNNKSLSIRTNKLVTMFADGNTKLPIGDSP